jgi:predicted dehydrogenase
MEEVARICEAEKKSKKIITIGFQPRYDKNMQLIKKIISDGTLGKIYYVQTGGGRRRGMPGGNFISKDKSVFGALGDIGCYAIDFAMNSIGYPRPLTVSAYASNYFGTNPKYFDEAKNFQVDDFSAAFIRLEGDLVFDFRMSWAMHMDYLGHSYFLGTDAGLKVKSPNPQSTWGGAWDGTPGEISLFYDKVIPTKTKIPTETNEWGNLFEQKVAGFVDAIVNNKPAPIPTSQIIYNQAIIDGIVRSSALKKEVDIIIPKGLIS